MNVAGASLPPPPRKVVLSGNGWLRRITAWVLAPAGLALVAFFTIPEYLELKDLLQRGQPTKAVVVDKLTQSTYNQGSVKSTGGLFTHSIYWLTYEVQGHRREVMVSWKFYDKAAVGDVITVFADPSNLAISRIDRVTSGEVNQAAMNLYIPALAIPVWVMFSYFLERRISAERQVLSYGIECPAKITRVLTGAGSTTLEYRYHLPDGSEAHGQCSPPHTSSYETGQNVTALYYEPDRKRSTLVEAITWMKLR